MSAVHKLITDHLDIWTAADTEKKSGRGRASGNANSVYGIKKLRELILELAVRGKLVPQDANDEPASELLKRIRAEKAQLILEGKVKAEKELPALTEKEQPFDLPKSWSWVRLGHISSAIQYGYTDSANHQSREVLFLRITDIQDDAVDWSTVPGCNVSVTDANNCALENGDLVIARTGGTIGKSYLVTGLEQRAVFASYLIRIGNLASTSPEFKKIFLGSILYWNQLFANSMGTGQPNVNGTALKKMFFSLPPLAEQHRIVAKVDELMALCDQLEAQHNNAADAHEQLVSHLLSTLTQSQDAADFNANWQRIATHFDTLFTTESSIDALKQTLLQLAVMGKLVPQDPNDEPASELLKRIQAEKAKLVAEGKIRKEKLQTVIGVNEKPFTCPTGWEWVRLKDVAVVLSGNAFKSEDFNENGGVKVIKITNVGVNELIDSDDYLPEDFSSKHSEFTVREGDLLLAMTRPYISTGLKISRCPKSHDGALLNQRVAAIRSDENILNDFVYLYMRSPLVLAIYQDRFGSSGLQPNLKISDITDLQIPLPPKAKQERILDKIWELEATCDQLKSRTTSKYLLQKRIAEVLVDGALN